MGRNITDEELREVQKDLYGKEYADRQYERSRSADEANAGGRKGYYYDENGNLCHGG
jgi:hypothetical protein